VALVLATDISAHITIQLFPWQCREGFVACLTSKRTVPPVGWWHRSSHSPIVCICRAQGAGCAHGPGPKCGSVKGSKPARQQRQRAPRSPAWRPGMTRRAAAPAAASRSPGWPSACADCQAGSPKQLKQQACSANSLTLARPARAYGMLHERGQVVASPGRMHLTQNQDYLFSICIHARLSKRCHGAQLVEGVHDHILRTCCISCSMERGILHTLPQGRAAQEPVVIVRHCESHPVSQRIIRVAAVVQQLGLRAAHGKDALDNGLVICAAARGAADVCPVCLLAHSPARAQNLVIPCRYGIMWFCACLRMSSRIEPQG